MRDKITIPWMNEIVQGNTQNVHVTLTVSGDHVGEPTMTHEIKQSTFWQ